MSSPLRIVLIEDNPGDARLIREYLRDFRRPTDVEWVETLAAAAEALSGSNPDVVLADLSLPDSRGVETVLTVIESAPLAAVIVLTGLDDEEVAIRAVQAGAQDYLVKGRVEAEVLGRAMEYAIERKQVLREREKLLAAEQEARQAAEDAVHARDQVLRIVSHDLGNHLAAVRINAKVIGRTAGRVDQAEANESRANDILRQIVEMERLRADLLDVASIEAGRLSIVPGPVDLSTLLEQVAQTLQPVARTSEVQLVVDAGSGIPELQADADRLAQALGNLVSNAIKFAPEGSDVLITAQRDDRRVVVSVEDRGPGIDPADAELIFRSFWKSAGKKGGAGLGLSIVRGIAEGHGGSVWVEPAHPTGARFNFALPLG